MAGLPPWLVSKYNDSKKGADTKSGGALLKEVADKKKKKKKHHGKIETKDMKDAIARRMAKSKESK